MNTEKLTITYELDSTVDLITEEAKRAFALQVEEVMIHAKQEIERILADMKAQEKNKMAEDRAMDVARRMAAYETSGLSSDRAWELVKQEMMVLPYWGGCGA